MDIFKETDGFNEFKEVAKLKFETNLNRWMQHITSLSQKILYKYLGLVYLNLFSGSVCSPIRGFNTVCDIQNLCING